MAEFTFVDLFAGIGGFRVALESLGGECVASSEIDSRACSVYRANWPSDADNHNKGDITLLSELPQHDLMCGGVPCQSWSVAGKMLGFEDPRGKLWGDVVRLLESCQPKGFIFENVKGLADPRNEASLTFLVSEFRRIGYEVKWSVLNAYDYGVPQNRTRLFLVGARSLTSFAWPKALDNDKMLLDYVDGLEHLRSSARRNADPAIGQAVSPNKLTVQGDRNEFFILNDVRSGPTVLHSWELLGLDDAKQSICNAMLQNRRSSKYGDKDGNPMSLKDIQELVPKADMEQMELLVQAGVMARLGDKFDMKNRRQLSGINGVYRIFLPHSRFFATLTASGTPDMVATKLVVADNDAEYRRKFVEEVYLPKAYRLLSSRERARIQGFPDTHILHKTDSSNTHVLGNAVPPPLVAEVAKCLLPCL
ncbi:MAG: DNA cytosine methyltransferase [Armatimonadetes bacterium]|nr:DNA cytosine methyltransferase [Armatimonadota bacterium]